VDARAIQRIVDQCAFGAQDTGVEIGAGLGALTEPLARRAARVIAVEVDAGIAALLDERMAGLGLGNVTVARQDILTFDWAAAAPAVAVGAIPYQITSPILVALTQARRHLRQAVLVMQHEVARRLIAVPGTKAYGRLSILGQYGWQLTLAFRVPRSAFFPQPGVDSACLVMAPRATPLVAVRNERRFFDVVAAAFGQRRKTLANCLSAAGLASRAQAEALLAAQDLPAAVRGEALSLEEFAHLANAL
jgi:16S rRNA (adenine1518-N6/adenine1519-N6)-dimethyltransferase